MYLMCAPGPSHLLWSTISRMKRKVILVILELFSRRNDEIPWAEQSHYPRLSSPLPHSSSSNYLKLGTFLCLYLLCDWSRLSVDHLDITILCQLRPCLSCQCSQYWHHYRWHLLDPVTHSHSQGVRHHQEHWNKSGMDICCHLSQREYYTSIWDKIIINLYCFLW